MSTSNVTSIPNTDGHIRSTPNTEEHIRSTPNTEGSHQVNTNIPWRAQIACGDIEGHGYDRLKWVTLGLPSNV